MRGVQCDGNEEIILSCPFQLNNGLCGHDQDAGVICDEAVTISSTPATTTTTPRVSVITQPPDVCEYIIHSQPMIDHGRRSVSGQGDMSPPLSEVEGLSLIHI